MTFEEFKIIFNRLLVNKRYYEELDEYPSTYSTLIVDDAYVNDLALLNEFLLRRVFPNHYECVMWFLWEWRPGYSVKQDGLEYIINNVEDYLAFKEQTWVDE